MPNKRSYHRATSLTDSQQKRKQQDSFFRRVKHARTITGGNVASPKTFSTNTFAHKRSTLSSWADIASEDDGIDQSPSVSDDKPAVPRDIIWTNDPWLRCSKDDNSLNLCDARSPSHTNVCDPWSDYLPPVPAPVKSLSGDDQPLLPYNVADVSVSDMISGDLRATIASLQALVEQQNNTIALLRGQLETPACQTTGKSNCADFEIRFAQLGANVKHLSDTLGEAIQKSLDNRLPDAIEKAVAKIPSAPIPDDTETCESSVDLDKRIHAQVMNALQGPVSQIIDSATRNITSAFQTELDGLDAKVKASYRYTVQELDKINTAMCNHTDPSHESNQSRNGARHVSGCVTSLLPDSGDLKDANLKDGLPPRVDPCATDSSSLPVEALTVSNGQVLLEDGMTANLVGLSSTPSLNGALASIIGFDEASGRYKVRTSSRAEPIKVKRANLSYPASCPCCQAEVLGSVCYACPGTSTNCGESFEHTTAAHPLSERLDDAKPAFTCSLSGAASAASTSVLAGF